MLANDPSSSKLERDYEQSAQENLERTSTVLPLTFVNMDPSKLSTMYTCIMLAAEQRKKSGWYCTTIKFDLPLEKTRDMVLVERQLTLLSGVNIRLGGFHYLLSERHNHGAGAHVFLDTAGGVTAVKVWGENVFINTNIVRW